MKKHLAIASLTLLFASQANATSPVSATYGTGQWKGDSYGVAVASAKHLKAVRWNPEKEMAPLSVPSAVASARASLKKMVGDVHIHFACDEVKINQENGYWFYVVRFSSDHPSHATKGEVGIFPAILPFIVYLDGSVEPPYKKR